MKNELLRYRGERYAEGHHFDSAMKMVFWKKKHTYPYIFVLASAFLCITGSQIENERSFSVAGVVTRQRRSRLNVKNLENIMQIYHNYQDSNKLAERKPQAQDIDILEVIGGEDDSASEDLLDL